MTFQNFWRCAHHPSAIDNFFEKRVTCEWDCHTTNLHWFDGGTHPKPKSLGGTPRKFPTWSDLQRWGL